MKLSRPSRLAFLALAAGTAPLLLALALPAKPSPPIPGDTPQQVADTLDSIVQPRFQQSAGRFGMDRISFAGHNNVYELESQTREERRKFRQVNAAHRPYVIAFLHCAHKPGEDLTTHTRDKQEPFKPYLQTLSTATATEAGTEKLMSWSDADLSKAVLPALPVLRQGVGVDRDFGNWEVVLRPVRALHSSCLTCHAGAKRGDTLGVMVYAVDKGRIKADVKSFNDGDY